MPPKTYINDSFLSIDESILESLALRYERRYEADLKRDPNNPVVGHLHDLCNILWTAVRLRYLEKLTKSKDKKLISAYKNKLSKI